MSDMKKLQYSMLNRLKAEFEEQGVPAMIRNAEEEHLPMDILTTLHREFGASSDEVMGEYYFFPIRTEGETVHYFTSMLSLTEDIAPECRDSLTKAIEVVNFYLECGAFVINQRGSLLAYKFVLPIPNSLGEERIFEMVDLNAGHSLQLAERYADRLIRLADGRETLEHFMQGMPQL